MLGLQALHQMEMAGDYPDIVNGCAGGGSNFTRFAYPFLWKNFTEGKPIRVLAAEPASCPSMTRGKYLFDYGDTAGTAPIGKMHTLGHTLSSRSSALSLVRSHNACSAPSGSGLRPLRATSGGGRPSQAHDGLVPAAAPSRTPSSGI